MITMPGFTKRCMALSMVFVFLTTMGMGYGWGLDGPDDYQPVTPAIAHQAARAHLDTLGYADCSLSGMAPVYSHHGVLLCYLFDLHPQGYMAVAAHRCLPPVIAYSLTSSWRGFGGENPLLDLLVGDLSVRMLYRDDPSPHAATDIRRAWERYLSPPPRPHTAFQQWPPRGSTSTGGWVETTWSQDVPYNDLCPMDTREGKRSIAGCPAVAMGQILHYHQTVNGVRFNDSDDYLHNYAGRRYTIDDDHLAYDFPSFPQLNHHLAALEEHYAQGREPTEQEIAALIFACGVAAEQVYTAQASGTFGVDQACQAYDRFGIDHTFMDQDGPELYGRLAMNMMDGLPAHLAVVNEDWTAGHNLVVDGYNTNHFFHLNFGWGGTYDGWYRLPQEMRFELTVVEGVLLDIMHAAAGSDVYCRGSLRWADIAPGETVTGSFTVANVGAPHSALNWSVAQHPDWGTWEISPDRGTGLRVGEETQVTVTVTAPHTMLRNFTGYLKVVNQDNPDDCFIVQTSLATPHVHQPLWLRLLTVLGQRFPWLTLPFPVA
ncbi:MAG TPA: hypothetical protein ENN54_05840 [Thermoplasmatales archaeon]|nr:hypothetical protein [Thermoplasmatales archaeon]